MSKFSFIESDRVNLFIADNGYYVNSLQEDIDARSNYLLSAIDDTTDRVIDKTKRRRIYSHEKEIFGECVFDGVLVSRAMVSGELEKRIKSEGGIKKYLHLPEDKQIPVMGDCGAWTFSKDPNCMDIPYKNEDIINFYEGLGFDCGISLDHVCVEYDYVKAEPENPNMKIRREFSVHNAIEMLKIVKRDKLKFWLIGSAQGWNPQSYRQSLIELAKAGFKYCAIGGVLEHDRNFGLTKTLEHLKDVIKKYDLRLHILGTGRLDLIPLFKECNVTSMDCTNPMIMATKKGCFFVEGTKKLTESIYLPRLARNGKPTKNGEELKEKFGYDDKKIIELENESKNIILKLREYDNGKISCGEVSNLLIDYSKIFEDKFVNFEQYIRDGIVKTLEDKEWKKCGCKCCEHLGVDICILRGSRGKLRGFHNMQAMYRQFKMKRNNKTKLQTLFV